jgi:hypothetical protein
MTLHVIAAADRAHREVDQRNLQGQHDRADREREQQRAHDVHAQAGLIVGAERLRDEPRRAHAQKAESPEHEVEEEPTERHAAEIRRAVQMPGDGGIDGAENRLGQIGEDDRKREREHAPMPAHGHGGCRRSVERGRVFGAIVRAIAQPRSCTQTHGDTTTAHRSGSRAAKSAAVSDCTRSTRPADSHCVTCVVSSLAIASATLTRSRSRATRNSMPRAKKRSSSVQPIFAVSPSSFW